MKVTKLVRTRGNWSRRETDAIAQKGAEVEGLNAKPNTLILMNELPQETIVSAVGHSDFTLEKVDYQDRWK